MPVDRSGQREDERHDVGPARDGSRQVEVAGSPVVVRRHAGVAALVGGAASAVAIAYLWRAAQTMAVLDWALFGAMGVIAATYLVSLVDARTPLLVADDLGVRIRLGDEWRGLPWEAISQVVVHPRRGLLRDGRLVVTPHSLARALDGLDAKGRRNVGLNQKMYGAALAVPLGATTRISTSGEARVADEVAALALGRADVLELDPRTLEVLDREGPAEQESQARDEAGSQDTSARRDLAPRDQSAPEPEPGSPGEDTDRRSGEETENRASERPEPGQQQSDSPAPASSTGQGPGGTTAEGDPSMLQVRREVFPRVHDEWVPTVFASQASDAEASTSLAAPDGSSAADAAVVRAQRRSMLGGIGTIVSRVAKGRRRDVDADPGAGAASTVPDPTDAESAGSVPVETGAPSTVAPAALRQTRPGLRAEATLDLPTAGSAALDPVEDDTPASEGRELRRPGSVDLVFERVEVDDRVRPISTLGDPVEPLVIDDYVTEPAYDPVIGPELTAARTRLGLSVDDLAERTRIRPHVIESIEVDDFAPCGGDFYARGHLRTLARILGKDPEPLLGLFEERYATAPINARRVFEAELATGMTGSIRSTVGGPSWSLMLGVALALILVWGVLRLFTTAPAEAPMPVINGAAVVHSATLVSAGGTPTLA